MPTANTSPNASRITLTFETGADPIRGTIEHQDGSHQPFLGWLDLISLLDSVTEYAGVDGLAADTVPHKKGDTR